MEKLADGSCVQMTSSVDNEGERGTRSPVEARLLLLLLLSGLPAAYGLVTPNHALWSYFAGLALSALLPVAVGFLLAGAAPRRGQTAWGMAAFAVTLLLAVFNPWKTPGLFPAALFPSALPPEVMLPPESGLMMPRSVVVGSLLWTAALLLAGWLIRGAFLKPSSRSRFLPGESLFAKAAVFQVPVLAFAIEGCITLLPRPTAFSPGVDGGVVLRLVLTPFLVGGLFLLVVRFLAKGTIPMPRWMSILALALSLVPLLYTVWNGAYLLLHPQLPSFPGFSTALALLVPEQVAGGISKGLYFGADALGAAYGLLFAAGVRGLRKNQPA